MRCAQPVSLSIVVCCASLFSSVVFCCCCARVRRCAHRSISRVSHLLRACVPTLAQHSAGVCGSPIEPRRLLGAFLSRHSRTSGARCDWVTDVRGARCLTLWPRPCKGRSIPRSTEPSERDTQAVGPAALMLSRFGRQKLVNFELYLWVYFGAPVQSGCCLGEELVDSQLLQACVVSVV